MTQSSPNADLQAKMSEQQALTEIVKEKVMAFDTPDILRDDTTVRSSSHDF